MFFLKETNIILFIFLYTQAEARKKVIPNFTKHMSNYEKDLTLDYSFEENLKFFYVYCERFEDMPNKDMPKKQKCSMTLKISGPDQSEKTCYIDIPIKKQYGIFNRKYTLSFYDNDQIIFAWKEGEIRNGSTVKKQHRFNLKDMTYYKELIRVRVYHMPTCKYQGTYITADERDIYVQYDHKFNNLNIVPYENSTFDLFFRNKELCGEDRRCRISYSSKDKKFDEYPVPWLPIDYDSTAEIYPIFLRNSTPFNTISTVKAYVVNTRFLDDAVVSLIDSNENILFSLEYSWSMFEVSTRVSNLATSSHQVAFGLCRQEMFVPSVDCSLFDSEGKATLGVNIELESSEVDVMKMRNLPGGGYAILMKYYVNNNTLPDYVILKISLEGKVEDIYEIREVECTMDEVRLDMDLYEREGFDYCYYIACISPSTWGSREIEHRLQFFHECRSIANVTTIINSLL